MAGVIRLSVGDSAAQIAISMRAKQSRLQEALVDKMTFLMQKLQEKIRGEYLSGQVLQYRTGKGYESVKAEDTVVEGTYIIGSVGYGGGDAFYMLIQEKGSSGTYAINPIGSRSVRSHQRGVGRRQGKDVLHFLANGKDVFAMYAFHPPITARHFMSDALEASRVDIAAGMMQAINEVFI